MKPLNIAIIGECMVELQQKGELLKQAFGGDTLNTALYLSRLTHKHGIKTSYVTALGQDPFSAHMLESWESENIDTSLIARLSNKQPGLYYIETDNTGERSFHYWRSDAAAKFMFDQAESASLVDTLSGYDAVYLSGITLAILTENGRNELFKFLENFEGKVFFDNNYRPKLWASQEEAQKWYLKMLSFTDTALLTFDDEQDLYGDENVEQCIERTTNAGVKELVIKRGGKECLVVEGENANYVSANQIDNIVDTTAAGDSFSAGFLAKRLCGGTALESAASGHAVAGTVIQYAGAIIPADAMPELSL
ncbi:sugar kinase [Vibrio ezurae]|uniref:2-dehydro-3-deoxygluconokinase n=1 Tax=Vibrio ezurae NBRC 102218 TaxID=1219080 RepID=U3B1E3_9VIBR|nr:sugar kinase [Vibrio ezurae]GAD79780.1 2-dehydro-3-deoxygluconokinase [Vibrio ezurae NBRC 102218]